MMLLAQAAGYSLVEIIIIAIVLFAAVAIGFAVAKHFGVPIPPVVVTIFWIVVVAALAIFAIKILLNLA